MNIEGLTAFQKSLISTEKGLKAAQKEAMKNAGNKAVKHVRAKAKREVKKQTGNYHKKFKRGKIYVDPEGDVTTRVMNTSPHGHLIENDHVVKVNGQEVGISKGKKIIKKGMQEYESTQNNTEELSKAIDNLLRRNKL